MCLGLIQTSSYVTGSSTIKCFYMYYVADGYGTFSSSTCTTPYMYHTSSVYAR